MPKTLTVYSFSELSKQAKERAIKNLPEPDCDFTLDECMDSLKALCKLAGVTLKDWEIGPYSYSSLKVEIGGPVQGDEPEGLHGKRGFAWIENNIFGPLRQGWNIRDKGRKYTAPEHVPVCPLTGVCFDEDLLDIFRDRDSRITIKERFESLAGVISKICESEIEYQSGVGLMERAESTYDSTLFTKDGRMVQ